jgi:hypothetical protein
MAGYLDWEHLKQVWRVEKERVHPQRRTVARENRLLRNEPARGALGSRANLTSSARALGHREQLQLDFECDLG